MILIYAIVNGISSLTACQQNVELLHKLLDYGDLKAALHMDEFFAEEVFLHNTLNGEGESVDLNTIILKEKNRVQTLLGQKWTVLNMFVSEDVITCYVMMHGIHIGEFMGLPATQKEFTIPVVLIYRFLNGKIVEVWSSWDRLGLIEQLNEVSLEYKN